MKTDSDFITDGVNKEEYFNYINMIDQYLNLNDKNASLSTYIEEEKVLREQINLKNEENIFLL